MIFRKGGLHPFISNFIDNNLFLLVYGPSATGKTHLAFEIAKYLIDKKRDFSFIATEAQTFTYSKYFKYEIPIKLVITREQLIKEVIDDIKQNKFIIIDSINNLFRPFNDDVSQKELSLISSMMSLYGGFSTGQISQEDFETNKMSMDLWVIPWAKGIGITRKLKENTIELKLVRPKEIILGFKIIRDGIEWI
ncbi:DNA replication protein [Caldisphaera lagunensis DSM 15908]|uniref:DNA replication protein n=1 Tax=Caldisphaera lagunensis (strain DSM 15908 / JCM 11604 / ANMR 0165 / IC-154) TaxID=1056495 RepID=L0AAI4_CALLD|nr:AAA family ATPase [Caldisphaera lagunensis]AFZ70891.1 DNA replication protein [Caldisphaera lagunensis DSM 15908]